MCECMPGKCSMVYFNIDLEIFQQVILAKEANYSFAIKIILVFGRFCRLGLNKEIPFEAIFSCIIFCRMKKACKVFLLPFHIGIEKTHISFSSTPENIIFPAKFNGGIQCSFYLCTCM